MNNSDLSRAARAGDLPAIWQAIGAYVHKNNLFHDDLDTALSWAAFHGKLDAVKCLIAGGADPFGANGAALNLALVDDRAEVAAFL